MGGEYLNYKDWICGNCNQKNTTEYMAMDYLPIMQKTKCCKCQTEYCIILPSKKTLIPKV